MSTNSILDILGQLPSQPGYQTTPAPAQLPNQGGISNELQQLISSGAFSASSILPFLQQLVGEIGGSPGASGYTAAAGNAGTAATNLGNQETGAATSLFGDTGNLTAALQQILTAGSDPQQALYKQQFQQQQDQTGANLANAGILNTASGQGVLNQGDTNFNIDWQNNLLQRMISAAGAYGTGIGQVGNIDQQAGSIGGQGVQNILSGGQIPYQANANVQNNSLQGLLQLFGASQSSANPLQSYLGLGNQTAQTASNVNSQNYAGQNSSLTQLIQGLGKYFGNQNQPSTGSGGFGGPQPIGGTGAAPTFSPPAYASQSFSAPSPSGGYSGGEGWGASGSDYGGAYVDPNTPSYGGQPQGNFDWGGGGTSFDSGVVDTQQSGMSDYLQNYGNQSGGGIDLSSILGGDSYG